MSSQDRDESGRRWYSVRLADFTLTSDRLSDVSCQQDCIPFFIFSFYRALVAGYFLGFFIYFTVTSTAGTLGVKFLIYLTDWTYMVVTLYLLVAFLNVFVDYILGNRRSEASPRRLQSSHRIRYQFQWMLFNISITSSIIVTLVYWPILRPMLGKEEVPPLYMDMSIHLFPSLFCLVDLLVTKITFRYPHVLYPALYLLTYGLFAVVYWAAGGTNPYGKSYIYPIIDFGAEPGIAVATFFGVLLATLLVHGLVKLTYYVRVRWMECPMSTLEVSDADGEREPLNGQGQLGNYTSEVI